MNWVKYFVLGDPNTQNPNPGDVFIKDGAKYLITQAEHDVPIFYDVSPFGRDDSVWNLLLNEADCLIIAGRPRLGLFESKSYCDYFFWEDVMAARERGIVIADLWAGSSFLGWDLKEILEACEHDKTLTQVIEYESMLDCVVVRDSLARDLISRISRNVDLFPCSTYWAADWYHVEPQEKTVNAVVLRSMPGHEWILDKLATWHEQLLDDKPTFFVAHGTPDYEWFLSHRGPSKHLVCIYDPRSLLEFYARVDRMVSLRVHGSIPALSLGAQVFHVATDIRSLSLNEFGVQPVYFTELRDLGALSQCNFTASTLNKPHTQERFIKTFREKVLSRVRKAGRRGPSLLPCLISRQIKRRVKRTMIRVHFETPTGFGFSIRRVEKEFKRFAPQRLLFVDKGNLDKADLVVLQFIGRDRLVDYVMDSGKPYVVLLYCFTPGQDLSNVKPLFDYQLLRRAVCAYSFHALEEMGFQGHFLLGPLGVDPEVFYLEPHIERVNSVLATGYISGPEALHEIYTAARRTGGRMIHVGGDLTRECNCIFEDAFYVRHENVTDDKMRELYNSCNYVSGLRRCCGFELPVLEGLLCGCRPICFDNLHYTRWFKDTAIFVPESFDRLVDDLTAVLLSEYRPVTRDEIDHVIETFSWRKVARAFWDFVLKHFDS